MLLNHLIASSATILQQALVITNGASADADDDIIKALLEDVGFVVTYVHDTVFSADPASYVAGMSLVVPSIEVNGSIGNDVENITQPVVTFYEVISDNSEITHLASEENPSTSINIINTYHPITIGLSVGSLAVQGNVNLFNATISNLCTVATVLSDLVGDSTIATFVAYESGTLLSDGDAAPARRVATFVADPSLQTLTTAGEDLIKKAFQWASGII